MTTHDSTANSVELAQKAGLRYVNDDEPGYRRKPWGRGFTFLDKSKNHISAGKERQRLESLAIPPAWKDVWICATADGHIQATGRDEKGRKQYIYHSRWEAVRDEVKFNRLVAFGEALPQLRAQVRKDLRGRTLNQQKVTALVVRLLDETLLRIGNTAYAEENGSYGLTTLQDDHMAVAGNRLTFSFPGKGGKRQEVTLQDKRLASLVQQCQDLPGQHLFQYTDEDGEKQAVTSTMVNDYLQAHTGQDFTAKTFRTWGATVAMVEELATLNEADSEQEAQKNVITAVKHVASVLGNTPAVCRQYYVHPAVAAAYVKREMAPILAAVQSGKIAEGLSEMETAVLALLKTST